MFLTLSTAKDCWSFIKSLGDNYASCKKCLQWYVCWRQKTADYFNSVLSNLWHFLGKKKEERVCFDVRDSSFGFWLLSEKKSFDIIQELNPNKPTGSRKIPLWAIIDDN